MRTLLIIPAYNEEGSLASTIESLKASSFDGDYLVINDGSKDQTWSMIKGLCEENSVFAGVNLSRNRLE